MIPPQIYSQIENGSIKSRRQLYALMGRSKNLLAWLDQENILVSTPYDKNEVDNRLQTYYLTYGKLPNSTYSSKLRRAAQKFYGTWNSALISNFGFCNQNRYSDISDDNLLNFIRIFCEKEQRLPNRDEFNGKEYPYFETYYTRFGKRHWADIIAMVNLDNLSLTDAYHGWGKKLIDQNGYTYLSTHEYNIGQILIKLDILFFKDFPYMNSNHTFDFVLPLNFIFIEYYGIQTTDYLHRIETKRSFYDNRPVLEIFKGDDIKEKLLGFLVEHEVINKYEKDFYDD